jgi:hypothetical protein
MIAGGMAITKLNAIDEARSVIPTAFTWLKKNFITSNRGIPLNPGKDFALLLLTIKVAVRVEARLFFIRVMNDMV